MRGLPSSRVIGVWERGQEQDSTERALTLLAAACPGKTREELAAYSLGRRDACLLELRERTFAGGLNAFAECPRCAAPLEYSLAAADLRERAAAAGGGPIAFEMDGFPFELRLPDSTDLESARRCRSVEEARRTLARRCVVGQAAALEELPEAVVSRVAERLAVVMAGPAGVRRRAARQYPRRGGNRTSGRKILAQFPGLTGAPSRPASTHRSSGSDAGNAWLPRRSA